jgi:hypothetical protein
MAKYFSYEELINSSTANRLGIDNTPTSTDVINNIIEIMTILDGIRQEWTIICDNNGWGTGSIIVNSGYRCIALNNAVGGSKNSSHMLGSAVDIIPKNGRNKEFFEFLDMYLMFHDVQFDELINEKPVNGVPSWVHFSLKNDKGQKRRRVFVLK